MGWGADSGLRWCAIADMKVYLDRGYVLSSVD